MNLTSPRRITTSEPQLDINLSRKPEDICELESTVLAESMEKTMAGTMVIIIFVQQTALALWIGWSTWNSSNPNLQLTYCKL